MAGCLTLAGLEDACGGSIGGIKTVKVIEFEGEESFTESDGLVSAIVWTEEYSGATFEFLKDNSNWVEPSVGDGILSSIHWEPAITLIFRKMSALARKEITEMTKGDLIVFIEDSNDTWWMIGSDRGLSLAASAGGQSGNKMDELNGYTILINGKETYMAYTVDSTVVDELPMAE